MLFQISNLFCFEHILLISPKGLGTSSNNLLCVMTTDIYSNLFFKKLPYGEMVYTLFMSYMARDTILINIH